MREHPGNDKIELSQYMAHDRGLNQRTFRRGLRELLEKQFLYRSTSDGLFFINIRFMFNGDRLAFVKTCLLYTSDKPVQKFASPTWTDCRLA